MSLIELNKKIADNNTEIQRLRNESINLTQPQPPFDYVIYYFLRQMGFDYQKTKTMLDTADAKNRDEISRLIKENEAKQEEIDRLTGKEKRRYKAPIEQPFI